MRVIGAEGWCSVHVHPIVFSHVLLVLKERSLLSGLHTGQHERRGVNPIWLIFKLDPPPRTGSSVIVHVEDAPL